MQFLHNEYVRWVLAGGLAILPLALIVLIAQRRYKAQGGEGGEGGDTGWQPRWFNSYWFSAVVSVVMVSGVALAVHKWWRDPFWFPVLFLAPVFVLGGIGVHLWGRSRVQGKRKALVQGREPLSDEEFLCRCAAPPQHAKVCLGVRRGLADVAVVAPESVYPSDRAYTLADMGFEGADWLDVLLRLEVALDMMLPRWLIMKVASDHKAIMAITVGEFGLRLGEVLEKEGLLGDLGTLKAQNPSSRMWPVWVVLMMLPAFIPLIIYVVRDTRRRLRQKREAFVGGRTPLSDEDFLGLLAAPPERARVYVGVRRVLAGVAKVPPERVLPGDKMLALFGMGSAGDPWVAVLTRLEKILGLRLMKVFMRKEGNLVPGPDTVTVGEFGQWLAGVLEKEGLTAAEGRSSGTGRLR
jgi:hypothetical protein